ncbi:MAG: cytochrome c family protein [Pseudomonadota bacterium]
MQKFVGAMVAVALGGAATAATAQPYNEGYRKCAKCHEAEVEVWQKTKHSQSFNEVHKKEKAKAILAAVGGPSSMRANPACVLCHYTETKSSPTAKPAVTSGPSCESCHGPSSAWRDVHNFYGEGIEDPAKEPPAHKAKRIAEARKAGMIWSFMHFEIAANCAECHGLAHPKLKGDVLAKMLEAGHPGEPEFELVAYSQGSVRHRFYPPDITVNAEMKPAELARLFVIGQAATLVSATSAAGKSDNAKYVALQRKRADDARKALAAVADLPEVKALLDKPTADAARKLAEALKDKDVHAKVKGLLPDKGRYK